MTDRLQELTVFVRAAESGNFSRAARELGLSQPSVSRIVSDLETRLGARLLLRTTRRVVPTDAGTVFLGRARQVLKDLEEAEDAARGVDSLSGTIRLALSVTFGTREVVPVLPRFLAAHPRLKVEMMMSESRQDLILDGVDMAIRLGRLSDSGFGARRLASAPRLVVASPAYLQERGTPRTLADLSAHDCVFGPGGASRQGWAFRRGGEFVPVDVDGRVRVESGEGVIACVKAGLGIAVASAWMCRAELQAGHVVRVLEHEALEPTEVHAVFPGGPRPSAKVRALTEHLASVLADNHPV
jgi:DNA-binding transcriptional LysR family regulator